MDVMEFINGLEDKIDDDETNFEAYSDIHTRIKNDVVLIDPMGYSTFSFSDSDDLLYPQIKIQILAKELHKRKKNECRVLCNDYYNDYLKEYLQPFEIQTSSFITKVLNSSLSYGIELIVEIKR